MNLAEAIRQAATSGNVSFVSPDNAVVQEAEAAVPPATDAEISVSSTLANADQHAVRIDLVLSPEQLSAFFRGVAEAERSVLTSREAAHYLRIPGRKLQEMAELGQIPAFLIDGKWRFSRNSVDEWLTKQSARKEMEA